MSHHRINEVERQVGSSEVQQRHGRLTDCVCPDGICPFTPFVSFSLGRDDTLSCTASLACQDFIVWDFASGSIITCEAERACYDFVATGAGTLSCYGCGHVVVQQLDFEMKAHCLVLVWLHVTMQ